MRGSRHLLSGVGTVLVFALSLICHAGLAAPLPEGWRHVQQFAIAAPGMVKLTLPEATLDAARPGLPDLRLYDDAGNEVPFLIERFVPVPGRVRGVLSFRANPNGARTYILIQTGCPLPIDGVSLDASVGPFSKVVEVEGSTNGLAWEPLARGNVVLGSNKMDQRRISFPAGVWRWLRLIVDDRESPPIRFTAALVYAVVGEAVPFDVRTVALKERNEDPRETRLTLDLGTANLDAASVRLQTDEPFFTRGVRLAISESTVDSISEREIGRGAIYRLDNGEQPAPASLSVAIDGTIPARELILIIRNEDSPPLAISAVQIELRPTYLVFEARGAGTFHLLTGNPACPPPRYDLTALGASLKSTAVAAAAVSAPAANPAFHAPDVLAGSDITGAPLDVASWSYHKAVKIGGGGASQLELDADVIAGAETGFADLRLMRGSNQVPYLLQHTSNSGTIALAVSNNPADVKPSRWIIRLPRAGLPLTRLACVTKSPLFQRDVSLFEELTNAQGGRYRQALGQAAWTRSPARNSANLSLPLNGTPRGDTLNLEVANGDNAPIELEHFAAVYPVTRLLFKARAGDPLALYYGNHRAAAPAYDLSLVAGELLAAEKSTATFATAQIGEKPPKIKIQSPGGEGVVFWIILTVVVGALLVIITRLLPKAQ